MGLIAPLLVLGGVLSSVVFRAVQEAKKQAATRETAALFTTKEPGRGAGLGLWLVERFAAAWGGRMDIQTAVGRGTTVRLAFPRADPS